MQENHTIGFEGNIADISILTRFYVLQTQRKSFVAEIKIDCFANLRAIASCFFAILTMPRQVF